MPLKVPNRARENQTHLTFRSYLDVAISSATPGARVDPGALEGMLSMVRCKEISPGDALSCFKTYIREGSPDEQLHTLRTLIQFVDSDPHLANMLHVELASRRWRERFVALAASPNPEVRPLLVATLQGWSASYRAHDIGMHYQVTLRELTGPGGTFRAAGPGYNPQYTGYSAQTTGYSTQATGAGYPPRPPPSTGYPMPPGPPPPPGYPPYGMPAPYPAPPPPPHMHHQQSRRQDDGASVATKLDQLTSEVEQLRAAIRSFEAALADYKAQRCPFASLSGAMERGQRTADRCTALQTQLENLLGTSDGGDEALMARIFSTNDTAVAALEKWKRLANQELAPDDTPAVAAAAPPPGAAASTSAGPSTSAAPPPPPPRPPPTPLDLLLGDELPPPTPITAAPPPPPPPPPPTTANGSMVWPPPPPAAVDPAAAAAVAGGAFFAATGDATAAAAAGAGAGAVPPSPSGLGPGPSVVPASDAKALRAQVLALGHSLEQQRRAHHTALEAQEAFHRSELAQVKAQAQARISELEAALARQQQQLQFQSQFSVGGPSNPASGFSLLGGGPSASVSLPPPPPPSLYVPPMPQTASMSLASPSSAPPPPPPPPGGMPSSNPFATFAAPPPSMSMAASMPSSALSGPFAASGQTFHAPPPPPPPPLQPALASVPSVQGSLPLPTSASATVSANAPSGGGAVDLFSAFDELAVGGAKKSAGGAPPTPAPVMPAQTAFAPPPAGPPAAAAAVPSGGASWVNFGQ